MSYHISITKQGDKFVAGIDAEGAYQASADTPLQALRKWIHYVGAGVVKYRDGEITLERLAERIGVDTALAAEIAEVETLVSEWRHVPPARPDQCKSMRW